MSMVSGLLAGFVKDLGNGKFGEGPKKIYWSLAGKKTWISLGLAATYGVIQLAGTLLSVCVPECASAENLVQLTGVGEWILRAVTVLIPIGLYDAAVRIEPPRKEVHVTPPRD
jgi:hypothetical protein